MKPADVERNKFFEFAGFKTGNMIWDFGCGSEHRFVDQLMNMGCKVYATDKLFRYGTLPRGPVDKFLLACVLHYNEHKGAILQKAYNQLKPGGHIIIIEPNPFNLFFSE